MAFLRRRNASVSVAESLRDPDLVTIAAATPRCRLKVQGQVVRMRARPTNRQPSLVVTISDDTGSVTAVWTGRRAIGGVSLGRRLVIEGVATRVGDHLEFTNPAYTLLP
jgi:RecG-like helicase